MSETSKDDWNRSNDEDEKGDYLPSQLAQIEATDLTFDIGENLTTKYVRLFYIQTNMLNIIQFGKTGQYLDPKY